MAAYGHCGARTTATSARARGHDGAAPGLPTAVGAACHATAGAGAVGPGIGNRLLRRGVMGNELRAGLVGCGSLSQRGILPHLSLPDARESVRLIAVADAVEERARASA